MSATRLSVILPTAIPPIVWGSTYVTTTELLPPGRPLLAATARALPAGLLLVLLTRRGPRRGWWWRMVVLGVLNIGLFFTLLFIAAYRLPGGVAAVTGSTQPLFVIGLGALLLGSRPSRGAVLGVGVGIAGVTLLVLTSDARLSGVGVAAGLGAALSMAAGMVLTKHWGRPPGLSLLATTGWQLLFGGMTLLPLMLAVEGVPPAVSPRNVVGFVHLAIIGAALAYALWFRGIERLAVVQVSVLGFLSPLSAAFLGLVVLDQTLAAAQLVGAAMVATSVVMVVLPSASARPRPRREVGVAGGPCGRR